MLCRVSLVPGAVHVAQHVSCCCSTHQPHPCMTHPSQVDAKANVCTVRWRPGSSHELAVGSADHSAYLYDMRHTAVPLRTFQGHRWAGRELGGVARPPPLVGWHKPWRKNTVRHRLRVQTRLILGPPATLF